MWPQVTSHTRLAGTLHNPSGMLRAAPKACRPLAHLGTPTAPPSIPANNSSPSVHRNLIPTDGALREREQPWELPHPLYRSSTPHIPPRLLRTAVRLEPAETGRVARTSPAGANPQCISVEWWEKNNLLNCVAERYLARPVTSADPSAAWRSRGATLSRRSGIGTSPRKKQACRGGTRTARAWCVM